MLINVKEKADKRKPRLFSISFEFFSAPAIRGHNTTAKAFSRIVAVSSMSDNL
jgi:hypothetical protein